MKICLIGTFSRDLQDEGHANIGSNLAVHLGKNHQILCLDGYHVRYPAFWKDIRAFAPDIVHFVPGATLQSLVLLRFLRLLTGAKAVMSIINPRLSSTAWRLLHTANPDLILSQCHTTETLAKRLGVRTEFLPNGVATETFVPCYDKSRLRDKYGLDQQKSVILHVGHVTRNRGLLPLTRLTDRKNQVLVIGSAYFKTDHSVLQTLIADGCLVWQHYFKDIAELYQLADCYVFPTAPDKAILMPLSVLEAMSCDLPVVSTKCKGLTTAFQSAHISGLFYIDNEYQMNEVIADAKACTEPETRNAVRDLSWSAITTRLEILYRELLHDDPPINH